MSVQLITRAEMVAAMQSNYNADVTERHGHDWKRINTIVADQGDAEGHAELDFHLVELCWAGRSSTDFVSPMENGDRLQRVPISPSALQFWQAGEPHQFEGQGTYTVQQLYIDDGVFREVAEAIAPGDPDNLRPLGFQGIFDPNLKQLGEAILDEARLDAPGGELYADLLAQQIALFILRRRLGGAEKPCGVAPLSEAEITRVIDYMEENLEDVGGMAALAGTIDMEVFRFSRAFRATTGEAPHQFLIGRRLARVKDMLLSTDESLAEIAYATGFSNQSHMTAAFSKRYGIPPGAYRKVVKG